MSSCLKNGDPFGVSATSPCCGTGLSSGCAFLQQEHLLRTEWLSVSPEPNQGHSGRTHSPAASKTPVCLWLSLTIKAMPSYARHREMYALGFPQASTLLMAIPTWHSDGLMNLKARCAETVVPTACPDIHSKLIITSICMSPFQDTGGRSHFRSPTHGETEVWGDRIMYERECCRSATRPGPGYISRVGEGFEIMTKMAGQVIATSLA